MGQVGKLPLPQFCLPKLNGLLQIQTIIKEKQGRFTLLAARTDSQFLISNTYKTAMLNALAELVILVWEGTDPPYVSQFI